MEGSALSRGTLPVLCIAPPRAFCLSRDHPGDLREDEESEGTTGEEELKGTYMHLVQGVQEWQDGCVYKGEFGLNMKLGHGEFSWPTGEVGSFSRVLSPESRCSGPCK